MLNISRSEIEYYCKNNNLNPNFDSSNSNNNYARNFIRNEVVPKFKQINQNYEESFNSLSILAYEEEQIIKEYINSLKSANSELDNLGKKIYETVAARNEAGKNGDFEEVNRLQSQYEQQMKDYQFRPYLFLAFQTFLIHLLNRIYF